MYLSELIYVHIVLFKTAKLLESLNLLNLDDYYEMDILPSHIYKTLSEHKKAVMFLAEKILKALKPNDYQTAKVCEALKHSNNQHVKSILEPICSGKLYNSL